MAIKQPAERQRKLIFVTVYAKSRKVTGLVSALKVGNSYVVSVEAYNQLVEKLNVRRGDTVSYG